MPLCQIAKRKRAYERTTKATNKNNGETSNGIGNNNQSYRNNSNGSNKIQQNWMEAMKAVQQKGYCQ